MGAERLRQYAQACRERAKGTLSPVLRGQLRSVADHYDREAELFEESQDAIVESWRVLRGADSALRGHR